MKKKILLVITFMFSLLIFTDKAFATDYLNSSNTEIECIYANGIVIGMNYNKATNSASAYVKDYPISKSVTINGDPVTNISLYNNDFAMQRLKEFSCPVSVRYFIAWEKSSKNNENNEKSIYGVYSFDWCSNKAWCSDGDPKITSSFTSSKRTWWWDTPTGGAVEVTSQDLPSSAQKLPEAIIPLVGERIYIVGDIDNKAYARTYKLEAKDAVGASQYAQFIKKDDSGHLLLKKGNTITSVNVSSLSGDYICLAESVKEQDNSRADSSYKFSSARHLVEVVGEKTSCKSGYVKYKATTETCKVNPSTSTGGSFCDKYGETSKVLIRVIKIAQILVPSLVLVFTGIEITRIVIAGNVDEELPKRKKTIIIRFIIMLVFFFLPLITQVLLSLVEGVDIADVSCLFNDGVSKNQNYSDDCYEEK